MTKKRAYNGNFDIKMELRCDMIGKSFGKGTDGVRAAIYWGKVPSVTTNYAPEHVMYPYNCYEWDFWRGKFEEY